MKIKSLMIGLIIFCGLNCVPSNAKIGLELQPKKIDKFGRFIVWDVTDTTHIPIPFITQDDAITNSTQLVNTELLTIHSSSGQKVYQPQFIIDIDSFLVTNPKLSQYSVQYGKNSIVINVKMPIWSLKYEYLIIDEYDNGDPTVTFYSYLAGNFGISKPIGFSDYITLEEPNEKINYGNLHDFTDSTSVPFIVSDSYMGIAYSWEVNSRYGVSKILFLAKYGDNLLFKMDLFTDHDFNVSGNYPALSKMAMEIQSAYYFAKKMDLLEFIKE